MLRIALHGYARVGKDEVGKILVSQHGLTRVAFGDLIKADLDALVQQHLGFSAFTDNDQQKSQIRQLLVHWGYANYMSIEHRFFSSLPERAVNTRIFRALECYKWRDAGGSTYQVIRPGYGPAEPAEEAELKKCWDEGLIDGVIYNDKGIGDLAEQVQRIINKETL